MRREQRITLSSARAQVEAKAPAGRAALLHSLYWRLYRRDWLQLLGEHFAIAFAEPSDLLRRALASSTPQQLTALMDARERELWDRIGDVLCVYRGCDESQGAAAALRWRLRPDECGAHELLISGRVARERAALKLGADGAEIISADVRQTGLASVGRRKAQALSG